MERNYDDIHGHPVNYIQCQCSSAHTFGNVTAFIQNWLINLFPENYFKTIHVNSKIAHRQLRSTPGEFFYKNKPIFIIRPRVEWNDSNRFLHGTPIIDRQGDLYHTYGGTNLQNFFEDHRNKIAMKYQLNRHVMNFDVIIIVSTLMQQLNMANFILNSVRYERPFNLETCLESYLSVELLKQVSEYSGVPLYDSDGSTKGFLKYMNSNSVFPITYKLQGSTGNEEFYRYYPVRIDTLINNFSTDDGNKVGMVSESYQISFSVRCEFYSTGFYYLFSDKIKEKNFVILDNNDTTIVPVFTDVITNEDLDLPMGWHLYASPSCRLEKSNDDIDISSLLNDSIKQAIKFHTDRGIPLMEFFKIRVRKQGKLTQEDVDWKFDVSTFKLSFINCDTYYTYKILIMINIEYINNLIKDIYKLK